MKKIIKKIAYFSFVFLLGILILDFSLNQLCSKDENFIINSSKNKLILGNSHAQYALNDSIIQNSQSFAQIGESFVYTYYKLEKLKKSNKQLDTVLLSISNDCFKKEIDDTFTFGTQVMIDKFPKYSFLFPIEIHTEMMTNNLSAYFISFIEAIKFKLNFAIKGTDITKDLTWGGYIYRVEDIYQDWILELKKGHNNTKINKRDAYFSKFNLTYLLKIVNFCKKNKIKLILIKTPLHKFYPLYNKKKFNALFKNELKNITFWDFSKIDLMDCEFSDGSHLNYKGAKKISELINIKTIKE